MKKMKKKVFAVSMTILWCSVFSCSMHDLPVGICIGLCMGIAFGLFDYEDDTEKEDNR